jgi:hypothetical protein
MNTISPRSSIPLVALSIALLVNGCSGASGQRAAEGAGTGALAGAAGGLVSGLLWGGDPLESAARGAVVGATTGAVVGGVSGAKEDKARAANTQKQEVDALRNQLGPDAFSGIVALAECKHEVAEANARVAATSTNSNYALAGLWVDALSQADRGDLASAQTMFPEIVKWDRSIDTTEHAATELQNSLVKLQDIRAEYKLPRNCSK